MISPHGVGRAFGITGTLAPISGLCLNLGLPRIVASFGYNLDADRRFLLFWRRGTRVVR
jgi:hypothetical protein